MSSMMKWIFLTDLITATLRSRSWEEEAILRWKHFPRALHENVLFQRAYLRTRKSWSKFTRCSLEFEFPNDSNIQTVSVPVLCSNQGMLRCVYALKIYKRPEEWWRPLKKWMQHNVSSYLQIRIDTFQPLNMGRYDWLLNIISPFWLEGFLVSSARTPAGPPRASKGNQQGLME